VLIERPGHLPEAHQRCDGVDCNHLHYRHHDHIPVL
jgi:hypothetical protein